MTDSYVLKTAQLVDNVEGISVTFCERAFYGGTTISRGDEIFIWGSGGRSGCLQSVGIIEAVRENEEGKLILTVHVLKQATEPLTTDELRPFRDGEPDEPLAELSHKFYRHSHDKIAPVRVNTAEYLREFFQGYNLEHRLSLPADIEERASEVATRVAVHDFRCPTCGSCDVVKSSVIVQQGTSRAQTLTIGVGLSRAGPIVGVAKSRGEAMTIEAERNVAPSEGSGCAAAFGVWAVSLLILSVVMVFATGGRLILAMELTLGLSTLLGILTFIFADREGIASKNSTRKQLYDRQWYCRSCGSQFVR